MVKNIKLPAPLFDVDTRFQSSLSLHPFRVTYSNHFKIGAVAIKYQGDSHLKFEQNTDYENTDLLPTHWGLSTERTPESLLEDLGSFFHLRFTHLGLGNLLLKWLSSNCPWSPGLKK